MVGGMVVDKTDLVVSGPAGSSGIRRERRGRACLLAVIALSVATGCVDVSAWHDDDAIGDTVKHRLYEYGDANLLEVEVSVSNRVVYLSGEADEFSYKEIAGQVARQVDRVAEVVNKVQVEP